MRGWTYAIAAIGGLVGVMVFQTPQELTLSAMLTIGAWVLYLSDRQQQTNRDLRQAIEELKAYLGPVPSTF